MENTEMPDELSVHDISTDADETPAEPETVVAPTAEDKLKDEVAQANDKYLRLYAEFDNFRRRTQKERADERKEAGKENHCCHAGNIGRF